MLPHVERPKQRRFRWITRVAQQARRALKFARAHQSIFLAGVFVFAVVSAVGLRQVFLLQPKLVDADAGTGEYNGTYTFTPTFTVNGERVSRTSDTDREQLDPAMVSDDSTGAIMVYEDDNAVDGTYNIYAQRFGSTGTPWWTAGGVRLAASSSNQTDPVAIADGSGGAVVVWAEGGGGTPTQLVGQRISSAGATVWGPTTFFVHPDVGGVCVTSVSPSGTGGLVVGWIRNDSGTYTTQTSAINSAGTILWTTAGLTQGDDCTYTPVYADPGNNAAYTLFPENVGRNWGYVQKYNLTTGVAQYAGSGVQVGLPGQADYAIGIGTNGSDGFHAIIGGDRSASCGMFCNNASSTLRAVRGSDSSTSTVTLMSDELFASAFSTSFYDTTDPGVAVGDSAGNMYVAYQVLDSGNQGTILVQKVTSGGVNSWGSAITGGNGTMATAVAVDTDIDENGTPKIILDGAGGVFVTWLQSHAFLGDADVYGQHIDSTGVPRWSTATQDLLDTSVASGDGANIGLIRASTTPWFIWDRGNDVYVQSGTEAAGAGSSNGSSAPTIVHGVDPRGVPLTVSAQIPSAISPTAIRWKFADQSDGESGFALHETPPGGPSRLIYTTAPITTLNLSFIDEGNLQPNTRYCDRFVSVFNHLGSSPGAALPCAFTLAYAPTNVVSQVINLTTRRVSWGENGNPAHTRYAVYERTRGLYVQTDGSMGQIPAWQTYAAWGGAAGVVVSRLPMAAQDFSVLAENGDGETTAVTPASIVNPSPVFAMERRTAILPAGSTAVTAAAYDDDGMAVERGQRLVFQTFVKNESDRDARSFTYRDAAPAGTRYVPGSVVVNGSGQTDALDGDEAFVEQGVVSVQKATLEAGRMVVMTFAADVVAASGNITGRACVSSAEVPSGNCTASAFLPIIAPRQPVPVNTNTNAPEPQAVNANTNANANTNTNAPVEPPPEPDTATAQPATIEINGQAPTVPTNDPTPEVSGQAEPGAEVAVSIDGRDVGTAVADESGRYVLLMEQALADGAHTVAVRVGGVLEAETVFTVDTVPPGAVRLGLDVVKIEIINRAGDGDTTLAITGETTPDTERIRLIIESDPIVVEFAPPAPQWRREVRAVLAPGQHRATAIAFDRAGNASDPVSRTFVIGTPEQPLLLAIMDDPRVERAASVVAPVVLAATVVNVVAAVGGGLPIIHYLGFLFTQPALLIRRRRRQGYGTVYNALSKLPIDLAIIRLREATGNRIVQTKVTDKLGRYMFFVTPGQYRLEITKHGFTHPTSVLRGATEDAAFTDLLTMPTVAFAAPDRLAKNIPLDPLEKVQTPAKIRARVVARRFQHAVALSGPVLSIASVAITPIPALFVVLVGQFVAYGVFRRLAYVAPPKTYGIVRDNRGQPVAGAVVRVFETSYDKLLETQVTDARGRYAFLVGKNTYYVTAEKEGVGRARTAAVTVDAPPDGAFIAQDVRLTNEQVQSPPQTPLPPRQPVAPNPLPVAQTAPRPAPAAPPPASRTTPLPHIETTPLSPQPPATPPAAPAV